MRLWRRRIGRSRASLRSRYGLVLIGAGLVGVERPWMLVSAGWCGFAVVSAEAVYYCYWFDLGVVAVGLELWWFLVSSHTVLLFAESMS